MASFTLRLADVVFFFLPLGILGYACIFHHLFMYVSIQFKFRHLRYTRARRGELMYILMHLCSAQSQSLWFLSLWIFCVERRLHCSCAGWSETNCVRKIRNSKPSTHGHIFTWFVCSHRFAVAHSALHYHKAILRFLGIVKYSVEILILDHASLKHIYPRCVESTTLYYWFTMPTEKKTKDWKKIKLLEIDFGSVSFSLKCSLTLASQ